MATLFLATVSVESAQTVRTPIRNRCSKAKVGYALEPSPPEAAEYSGRAPMVELSAACLRHTA